MEGRKIQPNRFRQKKSQHCQQNNSNFESEDSSNDEKIKERNIGRRDLNQGIPSPFKNKYPLRSRRKVNDSETKLPAATYTRKNNVNQKNPMLDHGIYGNDSKTKLWEAACSTNKNNNVNQKDSMSYTRLERLAETTTENIVYVLLNKMNGFEELLKNKPRTDLVFLILKLASRVCSFEYVNNQSSVLMLVCSFEFLDHLKTQISDMLIEEAHPRIARMSEFFKYLLVIYKKVIELLPSIAFERLSKLIVITEVIMKNIGPMKNIVIEKQLFEDLECLKKQLEAIKEHMIKQETSNPKMNQYILPPDDFREICLYPTTQDMIKRNFVQPNIVNGSYLDTNQYLDIQFRLLREDFIDPLRAGLKIYKESINKTGKKLRNPHIRLYSNVTFRPSNVANSKRADKVSYTVDLSNDKKIRNINWEYSKRFLHGSLLIVTKDHFNSFFLCTVSDNDKKLLAEKKMFKVLFVTDPPSDLMYSTYTMAESTVFFEPYYYVLRAIQKMSPYSLPMEDYILSKDVKKDSFPAYLNNSSQLIIGNTKCDVLIPHSWPTDLQLGIDSSQYAAYQAALSKEFSVIQGPPGTGKTYLGLMIARTLLKNHHNWNQGNLPMAVVCYTNHALDQFLEGLLCVTNKLVRIGSRSKNDKLHSYSINALRHSFGRNGNIFTEDIHSAIGELRQQIHYVQEIITIIHDAKGLLKLAILKEVVNTEQYNELNNDPENFQYWLFNQYIDIRDETSKFQPSDIKNISNDGVDDFDQRRLEAMCDDFDDINIYYTEGDTILELSFESLQMKMVQIEDLLSKTPVENLTANDVYQHMLMRDNLSTFKFAYYEGRAKLSAPEASMFDTNEMTCNNNLEEVSVWDLSTEDRWKLYNLWIAKLLICLKKKLVKLQTEHDKFIDQLQEINEIEHSKAIKHNSIQVLGLTTTGAAKHQALLTDLKPQIVIIEEAAEVLEAHITISLTKHCEHLILIGDHKQLRPNPATFKLAKDYKLDISLFERMAMSGMNTYSLEVQHRMRPEIAALVTPAIYPKLKNHESVLDYPHVKGLVHDLYFIDHNIPESEISDSESHSNQHEADFLLALCRHLILQGYNTDEITILTTYSAQYYYLRKESKKFDVLQGVHITVVDNYQGEENEIILLSLVRSNEQGNIGFLSIENRVCVALSRAKIGFYIIGNMSNLKQKTELWQQINATLMDQNAIGPELMLQCQVHNKRTNVKCAEDFNAVIEGGCSDKCRKLLDCGHYCMRLCHVTDIEHEQYKCFEKCDREICQEFNHPCPLFCHEECKKCEVKVRRMLNCNHEMYLPCHMTVEEAKCPILIDVIHPYCSHKTIKKCYEDITKFQCQLKCEIRLFCGHSCDKLCHVMKDPDHLEYNCMKDCAKNNRNCSMNHPCTKRCFEECGDCLVKIKKELPCGHFQTVDCSTDVTRVLCEKPCKKTLPCGHKCRNKCFMTCGNCKERAIKKIPDCGHQVLIACDKEPTREMCTSMCERTLICGHNCKNACKENCLDFKCYEMELSSVKPACGHNARIPCFISKKEVSDPYSDNLLRYCMEPCSAILPCGDKCAGTCGECMQGRIHDICKAKCGNVLICGHECTVPCRFECPPCKKKCSYYCKHSKCGRKCGLPCRPCMEKCSWKCVHYSCTKKCGELCDRPPCYEPCQRKLKCGHKCVGFCGDVCPKLCRVCNKEELTEIFFGTEDEPGSRFVFLEDCRHTLEISGLDLWLQKCNKDNGEKEIWAITCPKCKTPIQKCMRFMNLIKKNYLDVQDIKKKIFGQEADLIGKQNELYRKLNIVKNTLQSSGVFKWSSAEDLLKVVEKKLCTFTTATDKIKHYRGNSIGSSEFILLEFIITYVDELYKKAKQSEKYKTWLNRDNSCSVIQDRINLLIYHLSKREKKISKLEKDQFNVEFNRFSRLVDLTLIWNKSKFTALHNEEEVKSIYSYIKSMLDSFTEFNDAEIMDRLNALKKQLHNTITIEEKKMIHLAMSKNFYSGSKQGHWFKCSNGHPYCITECGGAMEKSVCPECKETIGGQSHSLVQSSQLDGTFDGATYAAYSETANMLGYDFEI